MRKRWLRKVGVLFVVAAISIGTSETVRAQSEEASMIEEMMERLDVDEVQDFLDKQEETEHVSFLSLVQEMAQGQGESALQKVGTVIVDTLVTEVEENRKTLFIVGFMALIFAVLRHFIEVFDQNYVSELCFLMVYVELMVLVMRSFQTMNQITIQALELITQFMKAVLPVYCMSMTFSNGSMSAIGTYELTFLIIYVVQWGIQRILVPAVNFFVLLELLSHMVDGERFTHMTELFEGGIRWILKSLTFLVLGMSMVRGMVAPVTDRMKYTALHKTLSMLPGVGNAAGAFGEILVGTGSVIKNGVGVAVMILLVILCLVPVVKVGVIAVMYKVTAAVIEPITDKRITGCVNGMFRACVLSCKVLTTAVMLFLITIAVLTMASGFTAM